MKFTVSKAQLKDLVADCAAIAEDQGMSSMDSKIWGCVNLRLGEDGTLSLSSTNLNPGEWLTCRTQVKDAIGTFEAAVTAQTLHSIWSATPDVDVTFERKEKHIRLIAGSGKYSLATHPDFMSEPSAESYSLDFTMAAKDLLLGISKCLHSAAQNDVRYFLNGMLLEVDSEGVRYVSTDGHRLTRTATILSLPDVDGTHRFIVPRKTVINVKRMLGHTEGDVRIQGEANRGMHIQMGSHLIATKLIDGKYPDYQRVIPEVGDIRFTAGRTELADAVARVNVINAESRPGAGAVRLQIQDGSLAVDAEAPAIGESAHDNIDVEDAVSETPIMSFNPTYLLEALRASQQDKVRMSVREAGDSMRIDFPGDDETVGVVMPLRI